nr:hypothetical protein [Actinomyces sp.]
MFSLNQGVISFMVSTSRRTLVKGAAWAVPAITVAAAAPAVAVSGAPVSPVGNMFLTITGAGVNVPGIKDPIFDFKSPEAAREYAPIRTYNWAGPQTTPTWNWNENGCQTASAFVRGVGVFTPHGTLGTASGAKAGAESDSQVGGSGLWIGSPVDANGVPLQGKTILSRDTKIILSLEATMNSEEIAQKWNGEIKQYTQTGKWVYLYGPRTSGKYARVKGRNGDAGDYISHSWGSIGSDTVKQPDDTSNGWRIKNPGVPMRRSWSWQRQGKVLNGSVVHTLDKDLVVSSQSVARAVRQRFNQVLVNTATVWEAPLDTEVVSQTWSIRVEGGTLTTVSGGQTVSLPAEQVFPARQIVIEHSSNPLSTC